MIHQTVHITWGLQRHLGPIVDIECRSFLDPWPRETFLAVLRQRNVVLLIAEAQDRVLGFILYELHPTRLAVVNFAVAPEYRRCGVGEQLLQHLIRKLNPARRSKISAEVSERNLAAQLFLAALGFRAEAILPEFFECGQESCDAYLMEYVHPQAPPSAARLSEEVR